MNNSSCELQLLYLYVSESLNVLVLLSKGKLQLTIVTSWYNTKRT